MGSIEKFISAIRWAADSDKVGYDQGDRTTVRFYSSKPTESDCSWLVVAALRHAGFETGGASYTGNMAEELCKHGWKRVANDGNPQAGDILLNHVNHVAVWLGDCLAQASSDENGDIRGGRAGDQTGDEVNTRGYYNYPWDCYLRWTGVRDTPSQAAKPVAAKKTPPCPKYRAFFGGKWQVWMTDGKQAGASGTPIYDFEAKGLGSKGWFQLTLEGGVVLPKNKRNEKRAKRVIGITVYYDTDVSKYGRYYEAYYRVRPKGRDWLKWETDDLDGGAGDDRNAVCCFQMKLRRCG